MKQDKETVHELAVFFSTLCNDNWTNMFLFSGESHSANGIALHAI